MRRIKVAVLELKCPVVGGLLESLELEHDIDIEEHYENGFPTKITVHVYKVYREGIK